MLSRCTDCGEQFARSADEKWKVRCFDCWRKRADKSRPAAPAPQAAGAVLDRAKLRQLLQLCHPDKHGGSTLASEVTAWLLSMRSRGPGAGL